MNKGRTEAFSDGVFAIIITIMVLELHAPHGHQLADLLAILPVFVGYILSYVFVGIYWSNHHHLMSVVQRVSGATLWANLHLLFWLSLIPFVTAWMGQNSFAAWPVALYGFVLLMCGTAYYILVRALLGVHGEGTALQRAIGSDFKGKISVLIYAVAIALAFVATWMAYALYVAVALMWLVPDRRMEHVKT